MRCRTRIWRRTGSEGPYGDYASWVYHYAALNVQLVWDEESQLPWTNHTGMTVAEQTTQKLFTGGKACVGATSLFCISCSAGAYGKPRARAGCPPSTPLQPQTLQVAGKNVGSDGNLWLAVPNGAQVDTTILAPADHYSAGNYGTVQKYHPYITANQSQFGHRSSHFLRGPAGDL